MTEEMLKKLPPEMRVVVESQLKVMKIEFSALETEIINSQKNATTRMIAGGIDARAALLNVCMVGVKVSIGTFIQVCNEDPELLQGLPIMVMAVELGLKRLQNLLPPTKTTERTDLH